MLPEVSYDSSDSYSSLSIKADLEAASPSSLFATIFLYTLPYTPAS